jgi:hypothetical protein
VSQTGRSKKRSIIIALPTVVFILILMSPYLTQWGKTHHQNPDEAPTSTLDATWYNSVFNGINPQIPIEALPDYIPLTALSQFSLGLQDPQQLIFQVDYGSSGLARDYGAHWRLECYDTYTGHGIEKSSTNSFNYYDGIPNSDPYSNPYDTIMTVYKNMTYSPYPEYIPAHWSYDYEERFGLLNFNESLDGWDVTVEGIEVSVQVGQTDFRTLLFAPIGTNIGAYQLQYDTPFVTDTISDISSQSLTRDYIPQTILDSFMILPDGYPEDFNGNNMSTTIQLAADLNDPGLNVFEQALTVLGYLSTQYTYDYDMLTEGSMDTPSEDEDYVEWFLNRGSGVSIHFAMAMTTLLNLENIAARTVTGFVYGEQDPGSSIRNVRALYIHSWVEVYIPTDPVTGEGRWVGFDPGEHPAANFLANPKDPNIVRSDYDIQIISTNPFPPIVTQGDPITIDALVTSGDSPPIPQQGVPITFENMNTSVTIDTITSNILGISSITYDTSGLTPGMYQIRAYFGTVDDIVDIYVNPPYTMTVWANDTLINQSDPLTIYAQVNNDGGSPVPGASIDFNDLDSAWSASNIITNGSGIAEVIIDGADTSSWSTGTHTIRAIWPVESLVNQTIVGVIGQPDPMSIGENPVNPLKTSTETSLSQTSRFYGILVSYGLYVFILLLLSIVLKSFILPFFEKHKIFCLRPMLFYT